MRFYVSQAFLFFFIIYQSYFILDKISLDIYNIELSNNILFLNFLDFFFIYTKPNWTESNTESPSVYIIVTF